MEDNDGEGREINFRNCLILLTSNLASEQIEAHWNDKLQLGRFHERPVGPHPMWSYQLAFAQDQFAELVGWLTLNHGALDIFLHPNTGDALRDHRDAAVWIGHSHDLVLSALN